ncbi:transcription factor 25-like [Mercenaria mercenaria]|uniref:transcription factor 25-like n=1 Tax=Mercenaria mercenaria TaxID=6596 RepID=UPI00234E571B|nr:transcription factor 25-like [Mercenaria mercenaria]
MSSRALRKLQGNDLGALELPENLSEEDTDVQPQQNRSKKNKKKKPAVENLFELLNEAEDQLPEDDGNVSEEVDTKPDIVINQTSKQKKKKKKRKKGKEKEVTEAENSAKDDEDEIDASIREVNRILNNGNLGEGEISAAADVNYNASNKALLSVEHKHLNPENELKRIFGSRTIREEGTRRRGQMRRRQKVSWMAQPTDSWPPIGKTGLSMRLKETKDGCQYFLFEHNQQYQKVQFEFYDAVESLNPQNIENILQLQPYHIDALIQLSEVFRMSEDLNMAAEMIERALYSMEMSFHSLFNMATGTCRLEYKYRENRSLYLALFKHIGSMGQRGCNRTALEFTKLLLSLDPDNDPLVALLLIDFYAIRSGEYEFLVRLYNEWEAHRNLSQLPNFAFSIPLAYFHQGESNKADEMLQDSLLMFPGMLSPLLDKCGVQADQSATHVYFKDAEYSQPDALKQLIALYVGRCYACWKLPEVMEWLEKNVKTVIDRVEKKDPLIETYKQRRLSRYKGTPRNIYRHILMSEIPTATATLPQDVASTVLSFDPLPPLDSVEAYRRPARPNRAQTDGNAFSMFLRSLMPNFNPNEPAPEQGAAGGVEGNQLRQGVGALMDAMRDLLNNIRMAEPPIENQEENEEERDLEEWD